MAQSETDSALNSPSEHPNLRTDLPSDCNEASMRSVCNGNTLEQQAKELQDLFRLSPFPLDFVCNSLQEDFMQDKLHREAYRCRSNTRIFVPDERPFSFKRCISNITLLTSMPNALGLENCPKNQTEERQQLFLEECQRQDCPDATLCVAVLTRNLHKVEHLLRQRQSEHIRDVLVYCVRYCGYLTPAGSASDDRMSPVWSSIFEVLTQHPEWGSDKLAAEADWKFREQFDLTFLRCLVLMAMTDPKRHRFTMSSVIDSVLFEYDWELLLQLVEVVEEISHTVEMARNKWMDLITYYLALVRMEVLAKDKKKGSHFKDSMAKLIQLGLSTTRPLLRVVPADNLGLKIAVKSGCADVVSLWYDSGIINQAHMLYLSETLSQVDGAMANTAPLEFTETVTLPYIRRATRTPRRLKVFCVQTISPFLGYRSVEDRAAKAQTLGLPNRLKDQVLFNDVVKVFLDKNEDVLM